MNEILLALVTFVLGILATVVTQFFNRKFKLQEQRQQKRTERLAEVEKWINSYQRLFKCKYPQMPELVLAHRYIDPNYVVMKYDLDKGLIIIQDKTAFEQICTVLKEFKAVENKHKEIEKEAIFALRALGANTHQPDSFIQAIPYLWSKFLKHEYAYLVGDHGFILWRPQGFLKEIAPHLLELYKQKDKLFYEYPRKIFYGINWELLETVTFEQFSRLLIPRHPSKTFPKFPKSPSDMEDYRNHLLNMSDSLSEDEVYLVEMLDNMDIYRKTAEDAIDNALLVIEKYKTEWL